MKPWQWLIVAGFVVLAVSGGAILTNPMSSSDLVTRLAQAIATAEGFFVAGSIPARQNNPGNIKTGGAIGTYPTATDGWNALYNQISLMLSGASQFYNPSMSLSEIGMIYADGAHDPTGAQNWINNVSSYLGVTPDTTLNQLMGVA